MKMKKDLIISGMAFLMAVSLSGCADVDKKITPTYSDSSSGQTTNSLPNPNVDSSGTSISDGEVKISIDETKEFPTKCKIYNLKQRMFSEQELLSLFNSTPKKSNSSTGDRLVYEADNQCVGYLSDGNIVFETQTAGSLLLSAYDNLAHNEEGEFNKYISGEENLDFASRGEVMENIKNEFYNKLGISPDAWYAKDFYAVKKEGVEFYKEKVNRIANESTEDSDDHQKDLEIAERVNALQSEDFYYITMKFKLDDIPLYTGTIFNYGSDFKDVIIGSNCYVIYTKKGIEFISLYSLKEVDVASSEYEELLIEPKKAYEMIADKYNNIIVSGAIDVRDMQLVYLPVPQNNINSIYKSFKAKPFYAFSCKQAVNYEGELIASNFVVYFDAITGEEFGVEQLG